MFWHTWARYLSDTNKGKMLEAYLKNADRCVVKEGYPKFGAMDEGQRAEWKAITWWGGAS